MYFNKKKHYLYFKKHSKDRVKQYYVISHSMDFPCLYRVFLKYIEHSLNLKGGGGGGNLYP